MTKLGKRIATIIILLLVLLITSGCDTYYTIQNGKKVPCSTNGNDTCNPPYYAVSDDGTTSYCSNYLRWSCAPITPSATLAQCKPNYVYDHLIDNGQSWEVVSQQQDQNNSSSPAQVTFTSTTSKTVTVTDKLDIIASLTAEADVPLVATITAQVKAEINTSVSQTVNATIGNSYNFFVPPGNTAYANYGVKVQITSGHLYDNAKCESQKSDWGTDVTYTPIAVGWCVWTNNEQPCPSI